MTVVKTPSMDFLITRSLASNVVKALSNVTVTVPLTALTESTFTAATIEVTVPSAFISSVAVGAVATLFGSANACI